MSYKPHIGMRIGALEMEDPTRVVFIGYGNYQGEAVPDEYAAGAFSRVARKHNASVPILQLDTGEVIYGTECWWAPEDQVRAQLERAKGLGKAIIEITVTQLRAGDDGVSPEVITELLKDSLKLPE